jgi:hypothetical protein
MFPRVFKNDAKHTLNSHYAVVFNIFESSKNTISKIKKMGITAFLEPDRIDLDSYNRTIRIHYDDRRMINAAFLREQGCCAFTRNSSYFYLFPIHKNELANTGITEQELIQWIEFLNGMRVGFKYSYFGEAEGPTITAEATILNSTNRHCWSNFRSEWRGRDNRYYWIGVEKFGSETILKPYLHWVCLRYLINSTTSSFNCSGMKSTSRLAYYNIPRIAMFFREEMKLTKLKSFLYAHVASQFNSGNSFAFSDIMGLDKLNPSYQAPCLNVTSKQFQEIWSENNGSLNYTLTKHFYDGSERIRAIEGLKNLDAPYDPNLIHELFDKGDYEGFVKHIEDSYKKLNENELKKEKTKTINQ